MTIKEGEPWILWPDKVSYGINKGNIGETFEGSTDFTLAIHLILNTLKNEKRTIFSKLPNYCGIDIEFNHKPLLILKTSKNGIEEHKYITSNREIFDEYVLMIYRYKKSERLIEVLINDEIIISYTLEENEELTFGHEPHIIFGSGNFPHNNFNNNFCSFDTDFLLISKDYHTHEEINDIKNGLVSNKRIVGLYDFKKHTDYKVYDLSDNCNFLHKIIV